MNSKTNSQRNVTNGLMTWLHLAPGYGVYGIILGIYEINTVFPLLFSKKKYLLHPRNLFPFLSRKMKTISTNFPNLSYKNFFPTQ